MDRKTARRYVEAAQAAGLTRDADADAVIDDLVGLVVDAVRPTRPNGHGASWATLLAHGEQIQTWVKGGEGRSRSRLLISRRTAEHHVQHIYSKIGVSSRAAATLFAIEHHLLDRDR